MGDRRCKIGINSITILLINTIILTLTMITINKPSKNGDANELSAEALFCPKKKFSSGRSKPI